MEIPWLHDDAGVVSWRLSATLAALGIGIAGWLFFLRESPQDRFDAIDAAYERYCMFGYSGGSECRKWFDMQFRGWKPRGRTWDDVDAKPPTSSDLSTRETRDLQGAVVGVESVPRWTDDDGSSDGSGFNCRGTRLEMPTMVDAYYLVYRPGKLGAFGGWQVVGQRE